MYKCFWKKEKKKGFLLWGIFVGNISHLLVSLSPCCDPGIVETYRKVFKYNLVVLYINTIYQILISNKIFKWKSLLVNKEKLLIDSISLFPCLWWIHAVCRSRLSQPFTETISMTGDFNQVTILLKERFYSRNDFT